MVVTKIKESIMVNKKVSIREKKFAKTKIAITNELIKQLETTHFEDIAISDLCEKVEVSEGTFYNYFPHKKDVLLYFQGLSLIYLQWYVVAHSPKKDVLSDLKLFYEGMTKKFKNQNVIYELIAVFLREDRQIKFPDISKVETQYAFPECSGIENISAQTVEHCFKEFVVRAMREGELPKGTNVSDMMISLLVLFVGTPMALGKDDFKDLADQYKKQLIRLWRSR